MSRRVAIFVLWLVLPFISAVAVAADKPKNTKNDDYYELYKVLVDTMDQVERNYVKEVDRRELVEAAIRGVLEKLDPYSSYIPPEEIDRFRSNVESEFGGIGIQVSVEGGQLTIISPLVGTPGYRAGLLAGDRIIEIEGKATDNISLDDAVHRLKGPVGTSVTMTVMHPGQTSKATVTVKREQIHVDTVLGDHRKGDDSWDFMLKPDEKLGYVRITGFSRETGKELKRALEDLQKGQMRGLVLDLRFNPGGLLSAAIEVSDLFIATGRIVSTKGRASPERVWDAKKEGTFEGFPMVVLVNHYSASASEIVAACLQDHGRAVVLGERTWGKGSVQNVIELEDGHSALKLTTAGYRRPNGKNIHRFEDAKDQDEWGVVPDKGHELKLSEAEMLALVQERRRRDVVQGKPTTKPDTKEEKSEVSADTSKPESSPPGKADPPSPPEKGPEKSKAKPDKAPTDKGAQVTGDRQLEAALKYLRAELVENK